MVCDHLHFLLTNTAPRYNCFTRRYSLYKFRGGENFVPIGLYILYKFGEGRSFVFGFFLFPLDCAFPLLAIILILRGTGCQGVAEVILERLLFWERELFIPEPDGCFKGRHSSS